MRTRALMMSGLGALAIAGCIPGQTQAPDEPIEINLNVTIRQEVVVRLQLSRGASRERGENAAIPPLFKNCGELAFP